MLFLSLVFQGRLTKREYDAGDVERRKVILFSAAGLVRELKRRSCEWSLEQRSKKKYVRTKVINRRCGKS